MIKLSGCKELVTFKSPEMLAPAKIPVAAGKKIANTVKKLCCNPFETR